MKHKTMRSAAKILGVTIVLGLLLLVDGLVGDPISRAWADHKALRYAQALYPDQAFSVAESYGGQWFDYGTVVQSQSSPDTRVAIHTTAWLSTDAAGTA